MTGGSKRADVTLEPMDEKLRKGDGRWSRNISSPRVFLLQSQVGQDFRILFPRGEDLMTGGAVIRNGLAIGAGVVAIMAAEAAGRIVVAKVVWMCAPGHAHVWKDISQVDIRHFLASLLHGREPRSIDFRIIV